MKQWLFLALTAAGIWGAWGFLGKLANRTLESQNLLLLSSLGSALALPLSILLFHKYFDYQFASFNHNIAIVSGFLGGLGALFFFAAVSKGDASKVVAITAMYPVVTIALSLIFLKEPIDLQKFLGVSLAVIAVLLLAK